MAYIPTVWQNNAVTPVNAENLNHQEAGIVLADTNATNARTRQDAVEAQLAIENTKEVIRIASEVTRVANEVTRVANEPIRISAETLRISNETKRETDYNTYKNVMIAQSNVAALQSQINVNTSSLADNVQQMNSLEINAKYPPTPLVGCKFDGVVDDTVALNNLITYCCTNNFKLVLPKGTIKTTAPIIIPSQQGFCMEGAGNKTTVFDPHHGGIALDIVGGQGQIIKDIFISPSDVSFRWVYTGVRVKNGNAITLDNLTIHYPKEGLVHEGACYHCVTRLIVIYLFSEKGIVLRKTANGDTPNGNEYSIQFVGGRGKSALNGYGIYIEGGGVNEFKNGQISDCKTIVYQVIGYRNWFDKIWVENYLQSAEVLAGDIYVNSHGFCANIISDGARIYGCNGQVLPYQDTTRDMIKEDKALKGLWFFNEGVGNKVLDKSGNKKHITLGGTSVWGTDGTWGTAPKYDYLGGLTVNVPIDTVDWTQPYTVMINHSVDTIGIPSTYPTPSGLFMHDTVNADYFSAGHFKGFAVISNTNHITGTESPAYLSLGRTGSPATGKNIWQFIYVDPINKKVEIIDPFSTVNPVITFVNSINLTPNKVQLTGFNGGSTSSVGSISMAGFWQRKLSRSEAEEIINSTSRPFSQFDKKVQYNTTLVSANGTSYKITVTDAGILTSTLV